jgi:hypothetical protein
VVEAIEWARAVVLSSREAHPGLQELTCRLDGGAEVLAIAYTELVGALSPGAPVWLNTKALTLGLGTGGAAFVIGPSLDPGTPGLEKAVQAETEKGRPETGGHWCASNPPPAPSAPETPKVGQAPDRPREDSGFLVKARYTPMQVATRGVDSPHSQYHDVLRRAESLERMPVVVADLHSCLPAICAAIRHDALAAGQPQPRLAYVMTDGAALPIAFSKTVARLVKGGVLCATITAGQAFGGDFEAVSVHSALLAARHVAKADITICVQGPGNLGTDTRWGFSGVAVGDSVNAISVLDGQPVGCLRVSAVDPRPRHRGLSHHSLTAYGRVALARADLAVPVFEGGLATLGHVVEAAAGRLAERHSLHRVSLDGLMGALEQTPGLSTMGRTLEDDPAPFLAAAAAGRLAYRLGPAVGSAA